MKRTTTLTILREEYTTSVLRHSNSVFYFQWKHFSALIYCGVGWSLLDIEMPLVLQRLSQMTNTVQKTTNLILFGPLPAVYTLNNRELSFVLNIPDLVFLVRRNRRTRTPRLLWPIIQRLAMIVRDILQCLV